MANIPFLNNAYFAGKVGIGETNPTEKLEINGQYGKTTLNGHVVAYTRAAGNYLWASAVGGDLRFTVNGNVVGSPAMMISTAGNVGIGTTSPVTFLDVRGDDTALPATSGTTVSTGTRLRLASTAASTLSASLDIGIGTSSRAWIQSTSIGDLSDGNRLLLNPNGGNVGIGTTSPSEKIDVQGNIKLRGTNNLTIGSTSNGGNFSLSSGIRGFNFANNNGDLVRIDGDGNVGIGTTSPARLLSVNGIQGWSASGTEKAAINPTSTGTDFTLVGDNGNIRFDSRPSGNSYVGTGNFGIGTTSPVSVLEVYGGSSGVNDVDRYVRFKASNGEKRFDFYIGGTGNASSLGMYTSDGTTKNVQIASGGTSYFNGGNVGIGTTSPGYKLEVAGTARITSALTLGGNVNNRIEGTGSSLDFKSNGEYYFRKGANTNLTILSGGNVGIGTTSPVAKLDVLGTSGGPAVFDYTYATNAGVRIHGDESAMDIVGTDSGNHASTILLRNGNEGFGLLNNPNLNTLQFRSFTASADGFAIHNTGSGLSSLVDIITLEKTGNVGIGTTSPSQKLHINNSTASSVSYAKFSNAQTGITTADGFDVGVNTGAEAVIWQRENSNLLLATNNSEKMRITSGGNVGIGNTNPQALLHITGTVNTDTTKFYLTENTQLLGGYFKYDGNLNINYIGGLDTTEKAVISYPRAGNTLSFITNSSVALYIDSLRTIKFNEYSGTNKTGTPTYLLGTDASGNVVKTNTVPGSAAGPYLPLAGGTMTGTLKLNDNVVARFGTGNDLSIYHTGTTTLFDNNVGDIIFRQFGDDKDIIFQSDNGSGGVAAYLTLDGSNERLQVDAPNGMLFPDGIIAKFGTSADLQIYHDGSNSYIKETGTGTLNLQGSTQVLISGTNGEVGVQYVENAGVGLRHNNVTKLTTESTGVTVTGDADVSSTVLVGGNNSIFAENNLRFKSAGGAFIDHNTVSQSIKFRLSNSSSLDVIPLEITPLYMASSVDMYFGDNDKIRLGTGSDLQIYHDGNDSYISDTGTGLLFIRASSALRIQGANGESMIDANENGAVNLYYDNSTKLTTGSVSVGTATTAGGTLIDGWKTTTQANAINDTTIATTAYVNNKIALIPAGLVFQGTWNAATNTPTLTSGSGTTGHFYIVSTDGSTNLDGITDWKVGDWAVFVEQGASDQWEKVDNSSVLDGFGTGQSVSMWSGSGTSNTLTDAPITISGSNTTVTGKLGIGALNTGFNLYNNGTTYLNGATTVDAAFTQSGGAASTFSGDVLVEDNLYLTDAGTARGKIQLNSSDRDNVDIKAVSLGSTMNFFTANTLALGLDASQNATFAGDVTVGDDVFLADSGVINLGTDNDLVLFHDGADAVIRNNTGHVFLDNFASDKDIYFRGSDAGSTITALTLDMSEGGNATFAGSIDTTAVNIKVGSAIHGTITSSSNSLTLNARNTGHMIFQSGGSEKMRIANGGNVGIATTSPIHPLYVAGDIGQTDGSRIWFRGSSSSSATGAQSYVYSNGLNLQIKGDDNVQILGDGGGVIAHFDYTGKVGIGTTSPVYKLDVNGGIQAGGKVTYTRSAGSLNTTGYAVAGLTTSSNGQSAGFTFTCFGHTGGYQKIVYSCYNGSGTWVTKKVINEGTNQLDVVASANGTTITFTFKSISGTMSYTPRVTVEAVGTAINSTYA